LDRILICDDNTEDLKSISSIIDDFYSRVAKVPHSLAKFSHPWEALSHVESDSAVDVAVLDILMPEMNGVDLAAQMRKAGFGGYLIFLSSSNDFAHQSYKVKAYSYILKPAAPKKVFELFTDIQKMRRMTEQNGFMLTHRGGTRLVNFQEFMYVESNDHKLFFHLIDGEIISIYATLKSYEEKLLGEPQILRAQKSYIVNLDYVRSCENSKLYMRNGKQISVSRNFEPIKEKWLERMFGQGGW
jgi:DNA-binding LytR/AlgR family response regulator